MKNKQQSNSITLNLIWQFVPLWKIHLCRGHCDSKPDQSLTFSNQSQAFSSLFLRLFLWPKPQTFCSLSPFLIATDHFHFLFTPPVDSVFTQLGNWELKTWMFTAKFHRSSVRTKLLCHSLLIRSLSCLPLPVLYPQFLGLFCPRQTARPCPAAGQLTGHCQPTWQKCRNAEAFEWEMQQLFTELYAGKKFSASFHRSLGRTWNFNPWGKHLIVLNIGAKNWFPGSSSISDKLDKMALLHGGNQVKIHDFVSRSNSRVW